VSTQPKLHIYTTDCTDPHWNLAYEEHLLRHFDATNSENKSLFIWRNEPTVVLGRYQNPWVECDLPLVSQLGAHLARRESGGGCVYHDLGNTNLTFFGTQHKPLPNLELIVRMLSRFGVSATITPRKDLAVNNRKVSGSAYRITGPRSYHHCTLLIDADLPLLWRVLHPDLPGLIDTKATESVRSHVTNLREHDATLTHETLARAMIGTFTETYAANSEVVKITHVTRADYEQIESVKAKHALFTSWEWVFGNTPDFVLALDHQFAFGHLTLRLNCKKAVIAEIDLQIEPSPLTPLTTAEYLAQMQQLLARDLQGVKLSRREIELKFAQHTRDVNTSAYCFELIDFYNWLLTRVPTSESAE
jgi:lipoate-protein ligase A